MRPNVLVLGGYGINCEEETKFAFEQAGGIAEIVHINDLIAKKRYMGNYQILAFPGGFSYGDDTGSGNAFANRLRNHLWTDLSIFVQQDNLVIGICNGFQILSNLGLLPALSDKYGDRQVALEHNDSARYSDRWVDVAFSQKSPWTRDLGTISLPIAHGEGKFYCEPAVLESLRKNGQIACRYTAGEICGYQNLPANPNGALDDIAGITNENGRVLGLMPHPERAIAFTHHPMWPLKKEQLKREGKPLPVHGPSLKLFQNAVDYFKNR
ncbi:MAG: phosphoribosylformylglycinamidine synthase subunit PurQ [Candidatus Diapherotrites archaeon]|nr:phosphoribosylformylglycinamidine synthase subunit PurQ [Candidatus Diapherotrites archaeon]